MNILRIHPSPFVTAGFLLAFLLLVAFLYGLPMLTSSADDKGDDVGVRDDCDDLFFVEDCGTETGRPTQTTPEPTTATTTPATQTPSPTEIDCNGPFHPSCFTITPTPEPTPSETTTATPPLCANPHECTRPTTETPTTETPTTETPTTETPTTETPTTETADDGDADDGDADNGDADDGDADDGDADNAQCSES